MRAIWVSLVLAAALFFARSAFAQVEAPKLKTEAEAVYPEEARGLARDVLVIVTLDAEGHVVDVKLDESEVHDALDDVALDAAKRYEFFPASRDGKPLRARIKLKLSLHGPPKLAAPVDAGAETPPVVVDAGAPIAHDDAAAAPVIEEVEDVRVRGQKIPTARRCARSTARKSRACPAGSAMRFVRSSRCPECRAPQRSAA